MSPLDSDTRREVEAIARHESGEHPALVNEKVRVGWPVLLALLGAVATGAMAIARAQDAGVQVKDQAAKVQALEINAARNDADHAAIKSLLERMDKRLDRIDAKLDKK